MRTYHTHNNSSRGKCTSGQDENAEKSLLFGEKKKKTKTRKNSQISRKIARYYGKQPHSISKHLSLSFFLYLFGLMFSLLLALAQRFGRYVLHHYWMSLSVRITLLIRVKPIFKLSLYVEQFLCKYLIYIF